MRKNIFKKIGLISKSGFLASSLLNIGAMESVENKIINETKINNEIKTLKQFLNPDGKDLSSLNNDNTFNIVDNLYNKLDKEDTSSYKIINKEYFLKLIKEYKEDILWPIKLGNEARKNAYYLAKNLREYISKQEEDLGIKKRKDYHEYDIFNYYSELVGYFIYEHKEIDPKNTYLGKIYNPIIEKFKSENISNKIFETNKDFDCSKLKLIHSYKFNNDQIYNIGRYVLHCITKDIYDENLNGNDKGSSELKKLFNGEINCTCNAFMLYTFLRLNKILCYTYMMYCHEFVLIPLKDEENKAINFYQISLYEEETINDMSFGVKDIIKISKKNDIWIGMNISDKKSDSLSEFFMFHRGFTPTYLYYENLKKFIDDINLKIKIEEYKFENFNNDIELIKYYLNGLKNAWQYINEKRKDKQDNYIVKFLPIVSGVCLFLLNVLDLVEPKIVEVNNRYFNYKKIMFNSIEKPENYVNLMYACIEVPYNYEENLEDVKLKINKIESSIDYSILYKKNIITECEFSKIQNKMRDTLVKVCDLDF